MGPFGASDAFAAATSLGDALCLPDDGACSGVVVAQLRDRAESIASFAGITLPADGLRFVEAPAGGVGVRVSPAVSDEDAALLIEAMSDGFDVAVTDPHTATFTG